MSAWLTHDGVSELDRKRGCTCSRIDGRKVYRCANHWRNRQCPRLGQACGGYCHECFEEHMYLVGWAMDTEIVVLCGSTRFREAFESAALELGKQGKIVLTVAAFGHLGDLTEEQYEIGHPVKDALDDLHKKKIYRADRVLVLNVGGYIGESTRSEIDFATHIDKPIDYLVPLPGGK